MEKGVEKEKVLDLIFLVTICYFLFLSGYFFNDFLRSFVKAGNFPPAGAKEELLDENIVIVETLEESLEIIITSLEDVKKFFKKDEKIKKEADDLIKVAKKISRATKKEEIRKFIEKYMIFIEKCNEKALQSIKKNEFKT